jgi:hypothetical protein
LNNQVIKLHKNHITLLCLAYGLCLGCGKCSNALSIEEKGVGPSETFLITCLTEY